MTYQEIVSKVTELCAGKKIPYDKHLAVEVEITGEGGGVFYVEVKDGVVDVQPYDYKDRDVRFIASGENFIKIASGKMNPVAAFTTGKLKIQGGVDKALEVKKVLELAANNN